MPVNLVTFLFKAIKQLLIALRIKSKPLTTSYKTTVYFFYFVSWILLSYTTFTVAHRGLSTEACQALSYLRACTLTVPSPKTCFTLLLVLEYLSVHSWQGYSSPSGLGMSLPQAGLPFFSILLFAHCFLVFFPNSHHCSQFIIIYSVTYLDSTNIYWVPTLCCKICSGEHNTHDPCITPSMINCMMGRAMPVFVNHCILLLIIVLGI